VSEFKELRTESESYEQMKDWIDQLYTKFDEYKAKQENLLKIN